jgi:hypothetical protein
MAVSTRVAYAVLRVKAVWGWDFYSFSALSVLHRVSRGKNVLFEYAYDHIMTIAAVYLAMVSRHNNSTA